MAQRVTLKVVEMPEGHATVCAPAILDASPHQVDFCCGKCGAVLAQAAEGQIHNLLFHCTLCETYNSTDS